jgi:RNA polymerase sigma-70 factor (ECF subfamily)
MTTAGVNSGLQRARARLAELGVDADAQPEPTAEQRAVVDRYVTAFERADVAALTSLLADEVVLEMPPMWNWYVGADADAAFMRRVFRLRGGAWRTVPVWANGEAGFAAYAAGALHSLQILTVERGQVTRTTVYQDEKVFDLFSLER